MLKLDRKIELNKAAMEAANLATAFELVDQQRIGEFVWEGYAQDKASRSKWEMRTQAAMDLAMQVVTAKNFPWPGCSNIKFPLVTIGSQQFHARAYPAIIQPPHVVRARVIGPDPTGQKYERALRISTHMSYQCLEQDQAWEEQHDRLLINLPIVGCSFVKTYFDSDASHNMSELVLAQNLVLDYFAKSVEACNRKSQVIYLYRNEVYTNVVREVFVDCFEESWWKTPTAVPVTTSTVKEDKRHGTTPTATPDESTPIMTIEQHCVLDLDGDGYAEPFIATIEHSSHKLLRLTARWEREADVERQKSGRIITIKPTEYYTKYSFIPSPDGGVYDVGFGTLLGPLNESVNALINCIIDGGVMNSVGGGFLGRGAKMRSGVYSVAPNQWIRVDGGGDDLHKAILPFPVKEPSAVLYNLLTLLVNYVNRVGGSTDAMVGENPGQNTPAYTQQSMLEQGQKIYNAIFKRVWRSMKNEFKKLYILNGTFMLETESFGSAQMAKREDYLGSPDEVVPVADPNLSSDEMQVQQATAIKQSSAQTAGYDTEQVERRWLRALKVDGVDIIYPGPKKIPPGKSEKLSLEEMKQQGKQQELQATIQADMMKFVKELEETIRLDTAKIVEMQAKAVEMGQTLQGDQLDREINAINSMVAVHKLHNERNQRQVDTVLKLLELKNERDTIKSGAAGSSSAGAS